MTFCKKLMPNFFLQEFFQQEGKKKKNRKKEKEKVAVDFCITNKMILKSQLSEVWTPILTNGIFPYVKFPQTCEQHVLQPGSAGLLLKTWGDNLSKNFGRNLHKDFSNTMFLQRIQYNLSLCLQAKKGFDLVQSFFFVCKQKTWIWYNLSLFFTNNRMWYQSFFARIDCTKSCCLQFRKFIKHNHQDFSSRERSTSQALVGKSLCV